MNKATQLKFAGLLGLLFLLSACSTAAKLDYWAGELLSDLDQLSRKSAKQEEKRSGLSVELDFRTLTRIEKKQIDEWLEANGYNRFGDPAGTVYPSGTPLVGASGETINRFEYILQKAPEALQALE